MPAILPPVASQGPFHPLDTPQDLTAGNDAKQSDGTSLVWLSGKWPDLSGASLSMVVGHQNSNIYGSLPVTLVGSVPGTPAAPTTVHMDVPAASSLTIPPGEYDYLLTATLSSGDKLTLAQAKLTVRANPGSVPVFPSV